MIDIYVLGIEAGSSAIWVAYGGFKGACLGAGEDRKRRQGPSIVQGPNKVVSSTIEALNGLALNENVKAPLFLATDEGPKKL